MQNQVSKNLRTVVLRSGHWVDIEEEEAVKLDAIMQNPNCPRIIGIAGERVNVADISGIFTPKTIADFTRRKNGDYRCAYGEWHKYKTKCECSDGYELNEYGFAPTN